VSLIVEKGGRVRCIYGETIELATLGTLTITRASHVEPDGCGRWEVDLSPVGGPGLGPFERRSGAIEAEIAWLEENWVRTRG